MPARPAREWWKDVANIKKLRDGGQARDSATEE
jgi:hypothetical protein